ncbi:MAG TPA: hypothetical protein VMW69_11060 [Spirochaetia bacterium]|nr:hypothetical protein [Spirochaetia bacterium]
MNKEELTLKMQALVDNELAVEEIPRILSEIEGSYEMRDEYVTLLQLKKQLDGARLKEPDPEWFEVAARKASRRAFFWTGNLLFLGSYALLIGYALLSIFRAAETGTWVKICVAGVALGFIVLLFRAIADRIRESRNDKYKGVMK